MELDWITPKQVAKQWGITERQVQSLCTRGKIPDVVRLGRSWLIPKSASKPIDGRTKAARVVKSDLNGGKKNGEERS